MDCFNNLPVNQKIILLVIIIIVGAIIYQTPLLSNIPMLLIILLTAWAGYKVFLKDKPYQHTCQQMIIVKKKKGKENFTPSTGLETRPSGQESDTPVDYDNIKLHDEDHRSLSYAKPDGELYEDRQITKYPFKTYEDADKNVMKKYEQDEPSMAEYVQPIKDKEIWEMYHPSGCHGDTEIARRMSHMATMPKRAIEARAALDKYSLKPFVEEELEHASNVIWWQDNVDLEHQF